jgi:hypothetical protein
MSKKVTEALFHNVYQEPTLCTSPHLCILIVIFHLRVSAGNPSVFRETFLLHECSVIKCARLLHNIEITTTIGYNLWAGIAQSV